MKTMKTICILTMSLAILLFTSCGGSNSNTPTGLMDRYTAALKAQDTQAMFDLLTAKLKERISGDIKDDPEKFNKRLASMCEYNLKALEGTTASAPVINGNNAEIVHSKKHITVTVKMEKENDTWCIAKCSIKDETPLEEQGQ